MLRKPLLAVCASNWRLNRPNTLHTKQIRQIGSRIHRIRTKVPTSAARSRGKRQYPNTHRLCRKELRAKTQRRSDPELSYTHTLPPSSLQLSVTTTLPTLTMTNTPVNTDSDCAGDASSESSIASVIVKSRGPQRSQSRNTALPEFG